MYVCTRVSIFQEGCRSGGTKKKSRIGLRVNAGNTKRKKNKHNCQLRKFVFWENIELLLL